ncbi:hypothetical protein BG011_000630 [Mortierella polycephala]|uniref:BLOC-1-related complex subunit 7 n=1 Tax=Mortierella polycephala TaxID=41804 RepID=A0A9P6TUR3_9FUNG|nr:hypothetical protein BG011_000630 [Mortierella polycephala]
MFVDDGAWASKLALKDKAQGTVNDFIAVIKAASMDAELPETLTETARLFATLDSSMKTTQQNVTKLSHTLRQVQDANFGLLDNLRATDQASESLRIQL